MRPTRGSLGLARLVLVCVFLAAATHHAAMAAGAASDPAAAARARQILKATGVAGGLVVHVGCGDGRLTAALHAGGGYLVQGLDTSAESVAKARKYLSDQGLYGRVTARTFDGTTLPYRDGIVNLVVVSDPASRVPAAEIMRVLAPQGVAYADGKKQAKPRPPELDEWTHYHHDPQGTMVGLDRVVGPPRGIQWLGQPKWLRNHDFMSSMHAMVSANGRVFYVIDEGLRYHIFLPSRWVLIARDAFSGTVLWRRPLKDWHPNNWPLKSGPGQFPRRLVAVGDRVFVTFGQTEPLTALDAVTGRTLRTYDGTKATEEVIFADGILYLLVKPGRKPIDYRAAGTSYKEIGRASNGYAWTPGGPPASVVAVHPDTGQTLWKHDSPVAPLSLTVSDKKVFFANGTGIVALERKTGKPLWTSQGPAVRRVGTGGALRAVYADGVLVFANGVRVTGLSAQDGKQLWTGRLLHSSHHCPNDVFLIDGLLWSANTGTPQRNGTHLKAIDLHTGEVKKDFTAKNLPHFPMHPRCYPSRATTQYLMTQGIGTEFYRLGDTKVQIHHYVRGSCVYGVMPCNGLLYKPPDSCCCYYQSKLEHFCALSPASALHKKTPEAKRLEKGPAYGAIANRQSAIANPTDWPMHRRDPARSGSTPAPVATTLAKRWSVEIGGKLTQPIVALGKAFVSSVGQQTLYALDAASGKVLWKHIAGAKIDSPPTVHGDAVLFGCADGWVYCLRAADGALAWRHMVAPADRQMVSSQRVESVWPLHGSVLIVNGTLYALAGRNLFFDGGMRLVRLDPATGRKLSETTLDENDPRTGKNLQTLITAKYMPVANPDIFSSDGTRLFMQEQNFDLHGKRLGIAPTLPGRRSQAPTGTRHLFCQTGLLDDVWFHRSYWVYGNDCGEGWGAYAGTRRVTPCGRIMAFGDKRIYAFRSDQLGNMLHPRASYTLYAADKDPAPAPPPPQPKARAKARRGKGRRGRRGSFHHHWQVRTPGLLVNAMVLAKDSLLIAGPPDVADETKMLGYLPGADDDINRALKAQNAAWRGERGGLLWAVSLQNGAKLAECKLDSVPVFDGMSVANGRVFLSLRSGHVACLGAK